MNLARRDDNDHEDLLELVNALTQTDERRERSGIYRNGEIVGQETIIVKHQPLLTQLAEAIKGTIGAGSSGTLASERNLLDGDALMKFIQIDSQIRDWCRGLKVVPGTDPAENLRRWYVARQAHRVEDSVETFHIRTLGKWVGLIKSKLDPWRERELEKDAQCPACGATSFWRDGHEYFRPLIVRYKPTGADLIQDARVICRACEEVFAVRQAAYELEKQAEAKEAGTAA